MKKVYISGKVTGLPAEDVIMKFNWAKLKLEAAGFEAINPVDVVNDPKAQWKPAMRKCIKALMDADAVLLLPCCDHSKGAQVEIGLAAELSIPLFVSVASLKKKLKINHKIQQQ